MAEETGIGAESASQERGREKELDLSSEVEEGEIEDESVESLAGRRVALEPAQPHPLEHSWTFWFDNPSAKSKQIPWGSSIRPVHTFSTVEDFWSLYNNIHHPSKLVVGADFHCFKNKIEPKWEDPVCANGGRWTISCTRGKADTTWLYTLLAMIGEQFDYGDEICGAVVNVRARQEKVAIWTKNASNEAAQLSIGKQWKEFLDYSDPIGFIFHEDAKKDKVAKNRYTDDLLALVLLFGMVFLITGQDSNSYNVLDHGAIGDGHTDDANAFMQTWEAGCKDSTSGSPTILVPGGKTFLLSHVSFEGPCQSNIHFQIEGNILAPGAVWNKPDTEHWIRFISINNLIIDGSGQIDGQGHVWWSCNTLGILSCQNVQLGGLKFKDSPGKHISIGKSSRVHLKGLTINAPGSSPNTDGIHVEHTTNSDIFQCDIGTGDDCISIGTGTNDLNISSISCGPGHGITQVEQIQVTSCHFSRSLNGVRIKTWQGGSGYARDITFENINFTNVDHPIVIDQFYCDRAITQNCPIKPSAVKVSNVKYIGLTGTTTGDVAINLNCSESVPCTDILMDTVNIVGANAGTNGGSFCRNASGKKQGGVVPDVPCLTN
ncbi:hypothetical protein J5N97_019894 [Dioscorea zingiberensis]|uniref:mRNA cap-binding protein n=1 Tax=Dioscorea zingiberensis TaxID=325984 RepID=A0A9D5CGV5_9LILI|nr:hypothetical protein J5N97_019894 [Dioscorea zingiberensis]